MTALHLVRLPLDAQKLYRFARASGFPAHDFDEGYAVHALLSALFDHGAAEADRVAPKPFRVLNEGVRSIQVLGYARVAHTALVERAQTFADPASWGVCELDGIVSRPVPAFKSGMRLGFVVRACPVRRVIRPDGGKQRVEVDAMLAKVWEADGADSRVEREAVYRQWIREELEKGDSVRLLEATLKGFRLGCQYRRTHGEGRKGKPITRPEAEFEGTLEVRDPAGFAARLARGAGRHRAFGFGMMLLQPPKVGASDTG